MTCIELNKLKYIINNFKKDGKKIVFTNGCFDILHIGHIKYLKEAQKLGDVLIVGINSDKSVKRIKGKNRPIVSEKERAEIVDSLRFVDYVTIFDDLDPQNIIAEIKPNIHVKGGDYVLEELPESKIVKYGGGETKVLKEIKGKSTSDIIQKILKIYS